MKTCTIILNWNGHKDTLKCISSLIKANPAPDTIIICDNSSTDHSPEIITQKITNDYGYHISIINPLQILKVDHGPSIVLIRNKANRGFAAGNNPGISYALDHGFDYIWLLNNDTAPLPNALGQLVSCAKKFPKTGIWGSTVVYYENPEVVQCAGGCFYNPVTTIFKPNHKEKMIQEAQSSPDNKLDFIIGASFLVRREVFEQVGLLNENYFLYYEELDFCRRAQKQGFDLDWCRQSVVRHKEGASTNRLSFSERQKDCIIAYHENLSTLIFTAHHHKLCLPFAFVFRLFGKIIITLLRRQFYLIIPTLSAYKDFCKKKFNQTSTK